jgi:hypothetical protein
MYLNVILTVFVVVQVVTIILAYKWWNKYGRDMFKSFTNFNQKIQLPKNNFDSSNPFGQIPDMNEMFRQMNQLTKKMNNLK